MFVEGRTENFRGWQLKNRMHVKFELLLTKPHEMKKQNGFLSKKRLLNCAAQNGHFVPAPHL